MFQLGVSFPPSSCRYCLLQTDNTVIKSNCELACSNYTEDGIIVLCMAMYGWDTSFLVTVLRGLRQPDFMPLNMLVHCECGWNCLYFIYSVSTLSTYLLTLLLTWVIYPHHYMRQEWQQVRLKLWAFQQMTKYSEILKMAIYKKYYW